MRCVLIWRLPSWSSALFLWAFQCSHLQGVSCVATFLLSAEIWLNCILSRWFSDVLVYCQIKSWHVTGFETQSHSWQQPQCQRPISSYLALGYWPDLLSAFHWYKKKYAPRASVKLFTLGILTALMYSVQNLPWLARHCVNQTPIIMLN